MKAIVGILHMKLLMRSVHSLKEKRKIIKSLKEKIKHRFNVSVAETGELDKWQTAEITVAIVGSDKGYLEQVLNKIYNVVLDSYPVEVIDHMAEYC